MTPREFVEYRDRLRKQIASLKKDIESAYAIAETCPLPANLRPATAADIVVGAIIWYPASAGDSCWHVVEEVRNPSDKWKAYLWKGARYGLDGAFVEETQP